MGIQLIIQLLSNIRFCNYILLFEFDYIIKEINGREKIVLQKKILDYSFFLATLCTYCVFCIVLIKSE